MSETGDIVFLVPGFFGFANLGDLAYFAHVPRPLARTLSEAGAPARVSAVKTRPTASFERRAQHLRQAIEAAAAGSSGAIHLVGHSSGGIDVRLLVSPRAYGPSVALPDAILERVKSVVTVAGPHRGTPLARFFDSLLGGRLLALLSLATMNVIRFGRVPIAAFLEIARLLVKLDDLGPANSVLLDQLFDQLLGDFSPERSGQIRELLDDVARDQSLIAELAPRAMAELDRSTPDRPGVRYGCVVTRARAPGLGSTLAAGLDPSAQATHAVYAALHALTAMMAKEELPALDGDRALALLNAYGELPLSRDNDGIVPTLSQLHGELICAVRADHLDAIGHFQGPDLVPPHYDWLSTGTGFGAVDFDHLWSRVGRFLIDSRG